MDQSKAKKPFEISHEGDEITRAARKKIDDDIDNLKRSILSLKTKRNQLSPISILPAEVLSKIFILARNLSAAFRSHNQQIPWIRVGHVCHHWREVALGCPSLWSVPVFTKPDLAQEMIRRSKMAALTIKLFTSSWSPRMLEELANALTQIHRIQAIELMLLPFEIFKTIFSSLSQPAPLLEEVSLNDGSMEGGRVSFPMDALPDAPLLRSIEFEGLNFSWGSAVFQHKNLTNLRLSNNSYSASSTVGQMMDILSHLPNLFTLTLNDSIPSYETSNGNEKAIEFKFLGYLELRAQALDCVFLLRHIQYPSYATVRLHSLSSTIESGVTILSLVGQNLRRSQSIETETLHSPVIIKSVDLVSEEFPCPEITLSNKVDGVERLYLLPGACGPTITICLGDYWASTDACAPLLTSLSNSFDLSSLQELSLSWEFTSSEIRTIQDTFGKLPKLRTINVSDFLPEICLAIAESPMDSPGERPEDAQTRYTLRRRRSQHPIPPVTIFPALRTLKIEYVDFRRHQHPENMGHLIDLLMKRSNMNTPIDKLSLEYCRGVQATTFQRRLGELVVDLEVGDDEDESITDGDGSQSDEDGGGEHPFDSDDHFSDDLSD